MDGKRKIMSVETIPLQYKFRCDFCAKEKTHQSKSLPSHWAELALTRDAYDYQGAAVANGSISRTLCDKCHEEFQDLFNAWATDKISERSKATPQDRSG